MRIRTLLIILSLAIGTSKSVSQLYEHGDYELNQLNLFVKYINESNNVLSLLYSEVANDSLTLRNNFESHIYHTPALTLIDRQTCVLLYAVIKSNFTYHKTQPYIDLFEQLELLRIEEEKLNEYILDVTENLVNIDTLSIEALTPYFTKIQSSQNVILRTLNQVNYEKKICELCTISINLFNELNDLLFEENIESRLTQATSLRDELDSFDLSSWENFPYPQKLLGEAITKLHEVSLFISDNSLDITTQNKLLIDHYYKPEGLPQLLNKAFEKYKNQNKETKYLNVSAIPIRLK